MILDEDPAKSVKEESQHASRFDDEEFYNPIPTKVFNKHYQPSLAFKASAPLEYTTGFTTLYSRPGIEIPESSMRQTR